MPLSPTTSRFAATWACSQDQYTLFVPPCGQLFEVNERFHLSFCPATWSCRKAKYLGIYTQKTVRAIGQIAKIAACTVSVDADTVTVADGGCALMRDEEQRILEATKEARRRDMDVTTGHKFYLCDTWQETDFRKTSPGGIFGHRYFDLEEVLESKVPLDVNALADRLRQRTWE